MCRLPTYSADFDAFLGGDDLDEVIAQSSPFDTSLGGFDSDLENLFDGDPSYRMPLTMQQVKLEDTGALLAAKHTLSQTVAGGSRTCVTF
jgi:hypothetical protein